MRVPSTDVQNQFGKYVKFAEAGEEIIVTKNGKDVVKLISCAVLKPEMILESAPEYRSGSERVTYEEYLELVENSEQRFELIDGVIYNLASPSYKHQKAIHELHGAFYIWFKGKLCTPLTSPFDITFSQEADNICVVQPDIIVICDKENIDSKGKYSGIPTLAIEVLSPSTRSKDMVKKLDLYKRSGVREYWIVDPINEQILVYALEDNEIANSRSFSKSARDHVQSFYYDGLSIALEDIFG